MALVFCVSCKQNNDTKSPAEENTVLETETTTTESTPKYEGSPAFVEIMTYLDETEAKLDNCIHGYPQAHLRDCAFQVWRK